MSNKLTKNHKKNTKTNKKKILDSRQNQKKIAIILIAIVVIAIAGGIAWSIYQDAQQKEKEQETKKAQEKYIEKSKSETDDTTVNVDPILDYLSEIDMELINKDIVTEVTAGAVIPSSVENK